MRTVIEMPVDALLRPVPLPVHDDYRVRLAFTLVVVVAARCFIMFLKPSARTFSFSL